MSEICPLCNKLIYGEEFEQAIDIARKEFEKAVNNPTVEDPTAYAMYKGWRYADRRRKRERSE